MAGRNVMIWSDHEEELFQLRRHRTRVLNRLLLAALVFLAAAVALDLTGRHHRGLGLVSGLVWAGFALAFGTTALLGTRWGMNSNTAERWQVTRERRAARKAQAARREQAIKDGTWSPRA
jgi:hypothetical protein